MWAVRVTGLPAPKGSMKCIGARGKVKHQLVEDERVGQDEWRRRVKFAGVHLAQTTGAPLPLTGPVSVEVTFTLPLPASIKPASRLWPITRSSGDVDKLARLILDDLTGSVFVDDSQVVELSTRKCYPHSPAPDLTPAGGALIRIWRTET